MSFNIRQAFNEGDGVNFWPNRAALNVRTIQRHAPDLIGFQEFQSGHLDAYREHLPGYTFRLGPEASNQEPWEYVALGWRTDRFEAVEAGGFWLSLTPDEYSRAWETRCIRAANWVRLREKATSAELLHLNTHLDHISEEARVEGSRLIVRWLTELQGGSLPAVVTGDFNARPGSAAYRLFTESGFADTFAEAGHIDSPDTHTFHGFKGAEFLPDNTPPPVRIDWILVRDGARKWQTQSFAIIKDAEPPLYPSDHYPILAELALV